MRNARRSEKGRARREQILQAATDVLAREGYRKTSMRAIGRELEIEPAHILYYFDNHENLLRAVVERWDATATEELGHDLDPGTALDAFVGRIRSNLGIPGITQVYLTNVAEATDPEHNAHDFYRERFARTQQILREAILFEQREGTISHRLDADREARKLVALSDGLQLQSMFDKTIDAPAEVAAHVAILRADCAG